MNEKLRQLRLVCKMTQEELAEKMEVSRQTVAKWESGESIPDMVKCYELAKIFDIEIEDIANVFIPKKDINRIHPKNKYFFGVSKIVNNRIVLSDEALQIFGLENGDEVIILGDTTQGIALVPKDGYAEFWNQIINSPILGDDDNENSN